MTLHSVLGLVRDGETRIEYCKIQPRYAIVTYLHEQFLNINSSSNFTAVQMLMNHTPVAVHRK